MFLLGCRLRDLLRYRLGLSGIDINMSQMNQMICIFFGLSCELQDLLCMHTYDISTLELATLGLSYKEINKLAGKVYQGRFFTFFFTRLPSHCWSKETSGIRASEYHRIHALDLLYLYNNSGPPQKLTQSWEPYWAWPLPTFSHLRMDGCLLRQRRPFLPHRMTSASLM